MSSHLFRTGMTAVMSASLAACGASITVVPDATSSPSASAASPSAASAGTGLVAGQKWIDNDIIGNVTADTAVDPTDNFGLYVNKDWILNHEDVPGEAIQGTLTEQGRQVKLAVIDQIKNGNLTGHDAGLVKQLFSDIQDMDSRNADGVEPARAFVERIENIKTLDDLSAYLETSDQVLESTLMSVDVVADSKDSSKYMVSIGPCSTVRQDPAEYQEETDTGRIYEEVMKYVFTEFAARFNISSDDAEKRFDAMTALETSLASAETSTAETKEADYQTASYNPMTMEAIKTASPSFPIDQILKNYTDTGVTNFNLTQPKWLAKINELYTEENVEAWKAVLLMKVSNNFIVINQLLDQDCYDIYNHANAIMAGEETPFDADQAAYMAVETDLSWAVGRIYAENCFSAKTKTDVTEMVNKIVAVYRTRLENNTWLSEETRKKAIEKLDALKIRIAYPDDWSSYEYTDLTLKSRAEGGNLVSNTAAILKYNLQKEIEKAVKPVDKSRWGMAPEEVNAGYDLTDNSINIPASMLGGNYYTEGGSEASNMGRIGTVIGHEITHGFDSMGSMYDKDGNLNNWWTDADRAAFKEKTDQVSAYYSQFQPVEGVYVDGDMTVGEAVADLGGMSCMLEIAKGMDSFDYKAFFEAFVGNWKTQMPAQIASMLVRMDEHQPKYLRANVNVQQFQEFYDTYDVKEGSNMYLAPADRLSVW